MRWYVATTGINQETLAREGLKAKGFDCYFPVGRKLISHGRKKILKTFPVISRYIFIRFDIEDHYSHPIRSTDGITDILCNNWIPMTVETEKIEEIKQREQQGEFDRIPEPKRKQQKWSKSFEILKELLNV